MKNIEIFKLQVKIAKTDIKYLLLWGTKVL